MPPSLLGTALALQTSDRMSAGEHHDRADFDKCSNVDVRSSLQTTPVLIDCPRTQLLERT